MGPVQIAKKTDGTGNNSNKDRWGRSKLLERQSGPGPIRGERIVEKTGSFSSVCARVGNSLKASDHLCLFCLFGVRETFGVCLKHIVCRWGGHVFVRISGLSPRNNFKQNVHSCTEGVDQDEE